MISCEHQKAIDHLQIQDVYLRSVLSRCEGDFDPKYHSKTETLTVQLKHQVRQSTVVELDNDGRLLRVFIDLGVRWIDERIEDQADTVMALIEAEYIAEYAMTEMLEKTCIDEFSLKNASFHVWPYWRELLSSQCDRMRLPKVMLPTMQLAGNRNNHEPEVHKNEISDEKDK